MEWDYKIGDPVPYFDITKSYEHTKYRPINKTEGLDFDPDWFRQDAIRKISTKKYSPDGMRIGTKSHRDFWKEKLKQCEDGYESNGYRITGDNFFWLNFYRLKQSKKDKTKASQGRDLSFPTFFVFQYEYFHYVELCEILGWDIGLLKARALGFSEMAASLCARPFITTPNYRVVASAFSDRHLKPLLSKIWAQLDWLNDETESAFKRIRMAQNTAMFKRASKRDKEGREFGHMAEIEGIVADSPEKIRGDRVERLFYEEAGSDKMFKKKWVQGEALITVMGGDRVGTRIAWGTGGDKGVSLEGIKDMTINPQTHNILPFRHNYTPTGNYILSAMFIPAYRSVNHLVDERGYCDEEKAKEWYEEERKKKIADPSALLMYKAEYCFTIDEAVIQMGDNMFPREELANQQTRIEIYKETPKPISGHLMWQYDSDGRKVGVKWRDDPTGGKIHLIEKPRESTDMIYKNLYVGGIDSIDIGIKDSSDQTGGSDFCIVVKRRVFGMESPMYVAMYKDRPRDIREAYENAAKLLTYYSCKAVLEHTRTAVLTHFRDHKYLHLLMKRPKSTMPDISKGNSNMYGTPTPPKVIAHYRELIYDFVIDYCETICFPEIVQQLLNYSDEKKREFDIVAAMGMCELGDEEMYVKKPIEEKKVQDDFQHVGWWKDGTGRKHWGKIPKTEEEKNGWSNVNPKNNWVYDKLV